MASKEKKGAKFGRHARNNSSKLQKTRTEKNRRLRLEKAKKAGVLCLPDPFDGRHKRHTLPSEKPSVVFSGIVPKQAGRFLHSLEVEGKLVEISPHHADIETAKTETFPRLGYTHWLLNPLSGDKTLVSFRRGN